MSYKSLFQKCKVEYWICILWITISSGLFVVGSYLISSLLNAIVDKDMHTFVVVIISVVMVDIFGYIFDFLANNQQAKVIKKVNVYIKECIGLQLESDDKKDTYVSMYVNDIQMIEQKTLDNHFQLISSYESMVFSFIAIVMLNYILGITSIVFLVLMVVVPKVFDAYTKKNTEELSKANATYLNALKNQIGGLETYRSHNLFRRMYAFLNQINETLEQQKYIYAKRNNLMYLFIGIINLFSQMGNILVCAFLSIFGFIQPGAILAVGNLSGTFYNSLGSISQLKAMIQSTTDILKKLLKHDKNEIVKENVKDVDEIDTIRFNNVSFQYEDKPILDNINLTFDRNHKYLLKGDNGSGKSTLLKIMSLRLHGYQGKYYINELDENNISDTSIRKHISYIEQEPYIFEDTLLYNLTLGSNYDTDVIQDVINKTGLTQFVNEHGLEYVLKENGSNVSGGQRRKIAIARELLRKVDVILFDEACSNLDKESRKEIYTVLLNIPNIILVVVDHTMSEVEEKQYEIYKIKQHVN